MYLNEWDLEMIFILSGDVMRDDISLSASK